MHDQQASRAALTLSLRGGRLAVDQVDGAGSWSETEFARPSEPTAHHATGIGTLTAVRRHWRLILAIIVGCIALTVSLFPLMTPLYSAKVSVMIDPRESKRAASSKDPTALPPSEETVRKNEMAIIRSRNLAESVVERLGLDRNPEFAGGSGSRSGLQVLLAKGRHAIAGAAALLGFPATENEASGSPSAEAARERAVDTFISRLGASSVEASRVIEIRFLSEDPERAAHIANAVADEYISRKLRREMDAAQLAAETLDKNIAVLNRKILESERTIEQLRSERGLLPNANLRVLTEQLSELNRQFATAAAERMGAEGRLRELQSARQSGVESAAAVLGSPLIQRLQGEAALLAAKIGDLSTTYGENHPKLAQVQAEYKKLRSQIDAEIAKVVKSYSDAIVAARAKENSLREEVESLKAQMIAANSYEVDVRALEREAEANKTLLTQLVSRFNDTRAEINLQGPEAWVISSATVPKLPSYPPKLAMVAAAFFISATGATILAVLLDRSDGSIRSMTQLRDLTSARVLGAVPAVKRPPRNEMLVNEESWFVESLRSVWLHIGMTHSAPGKRLLVTSSVSGEGKSSTATCLALLLARAGHRVVIVDADLRNPSVHKAFGMSQSPGLVELVSGTSEPDDVLQIDEASCTYVIPAGGPASSPSATLESPKLREVLSGLAASFDFVIIDSPPVLAVHDANILAQHADTKIMVVRWGGTKIGTFVTALRRMADLGHSVDGVVLSMVDRKKYRLFGYPDGEIFSPAFRKYYSRPWKRSGAAVELQREFPPPRNFA